MEVELKGGVQVVIERKTNNLGQNEMRN